MSAESKDLGFIKAAQLVLEQADEPLHYREITHRALDSSWLTTSGKTPEATMNAQLATRINKKGEDSIFVRTGPGIFGLRRWVREGKIDPKVEADMRIFIPFFPVYDLTRAALPAWEGEERTSITGTIRTVHTLRGTPQEPQDWTDPDRWIEERLTGDPKRVALLTWQKSEGKVNPRYSELHWRLATHHDLLADDAEGRLILTSRGREFVENVDGKVVQQIDESEGLLKLLAVVAEIGPASRGDLLAPFGEYIRSESRLKSDAAIKAALYARLRNLIDRDLVERVGTSYAITPSGLEYLQRAGGGGEITLDQEIRRLLSEQKNSVRQEVQEILAEMDPFAFEHFIKRLLEEIGYEDVEVTAPSGDKGVDVLGTIELGITSVREVIQVKRQKGNIQRHVLDALRGVLHRFRAVRGTIITTGGFSKGTREAAFEPGAAPITLIDGERLLDLLIEHGLGVKKKKAELWELDSDAFSGLLPDEEDEGDASGFGDRR